MKQTLLALTITSLAAAFAVAQAQAPANKSAPAAVQQNQNPNNPDHANQPAAKAPFLGVSVESVPSAVASQIPGVIHKGQGLLIQRVAKDSPAAKAGLQEGDVLLRFGPQELNSPEQLVRIVRDDKPGREVTLTFVRGGKSESCKVTLGERDVNAEGNRRVFRMQPGDQFREMFEEFGSKNDKQAWDTFDAMNLTRVDADHWRAQIDYRNKEGKKEHKSFEGTRDQIRQDIRNDKDLPATEQRHLLRALNVHEPIFEFHLPPFENPGNDF